MKIILALLAALGIAQAAPTAIIWSATDHSYAINIAGETATRPGTTGSIWVAARSDTSQSTGVRTVYLTVLESGTYGVNFGLANGLASINNYAGADANGLSYRPNGNVIKGGAWVGVAPLPPTFTAGDVLGMQVDFGAHTVKFNKNGGGWSGAIDITSLGTDIFVAVSLAAGAESSAQLTADNWNDYTVPTLNLIGHGDSLSLIANVDLGYLPRLAALIRANNVGWATWEREGINGASWNFAWSQAGYPYTLTQDIPVRVIPALSPNLPNWVIAWAGSNGAALAFHSATTEYANLQTDVNAIIAAGVPANHVIVPTMLPRTGLSETIRTAYNAAIVADAGAIGYKVARFDLDPTYGVAGANSNPALYPDGVHPVDAAHVIFAQILYGLIFP